MSSVDSKVRMLSHLIIFSGGAGGGWGTITNDVLHVEAPPYVLTPYPFIYTF